MSNPLLVPPRTEEVLLYRPGVEQGLDELRDRLNQLIVDVEDAEADVEEAQAQADRPGATPTRMNKTSPLRTAIAARDEKVAERDKVAEAYDTQARAAGDARVRLLFREPSSDEYDELRDRHPARDNVVADQQVGHNTDTFPPALVRLCLAEPVVSDEQWDEFRHGRPAAPDAEPGTPEAEPVAGVSLFNWSKISLAVARLCNTEPQLPNPYAVSSLRRMTERASRRQHDTESAPDASTE